MEKINLIDEELKLEIKSTENQISDNKKNILVFTIMIIIDFFLLYYHLNEGNIFSIYLVILSILIFSMFIGTLITQNNFFSNYLINLNKLLEYKKDL